ncbi:hypothetical protein [Dysosmobacter sp. HCP28S3_G4]|uniref:hypothetical protein n=1 Tax=Dysosmobacter sp. HCP28S3_G4 TaxID=3438938 RepID=UPI003F8AF428
MNSTSYTKEKKLRFSAVGIHLTDIPVMKSVRLSFYEKYIVLLLQKGFSAGSFDELGQKLSEFLNVSLDCVREFLNFLQERHYLLFDEFLQRFVLGSSFHVSIKPENGNTMFAGLDVKQADCDSILYIEEADDFFLASDFLPDIYHRTDSPSILLPTDVCNAAAARSKRICELIVRDFQDTDKYLQPEFTYRVECIVSPVYQYDFSALIQYEYSRENNQSVRKATICADNLLPQKLIDTLSKPYDIDDSLPRFIALDEKLYEKVRPATERLTALEADIGRAALAKEPISQEIKKYKDELKQESREYKKRREGKDQSYNESVQLLNGKENDINSYELLIANTENHELIAHLKDTVAELQKERDRLSCIVESNKDALKQLESGYMDKVKTLQSLIDQKQSEIDQIMENEDTWRNSFDDLSKEYNHLLSKNKGKLTLITKKVIEKYPSTLNIFNRYICDICLQLDEAVSASENGAFDEVGRCIDMSRELYRKVMKVVFDTLLSKNLQNLGSYFSDPFIRAEIDDVFRKRSIKTELRSKLESFHALANAIGHSTENSSRKKENEKRLEDFKHLSVADRNTLLLCVPTFFNSICFSKAEIVSITAKLKV